MTSLVIVDLTPINKEKLAQYSAKAAQTLIPYHGRFIAKGAIQVLNEEELTEETNHPMKAVIEFPNQEAAQNWYQSEAYQAIIPLRKQGMKSQFHLV